MSNIQNIQNEIYNEIQKRKQQSKRVILNETKNKIWKNEIKNGKSKQIILNDDVMIKIFEYKHNLEYKDVMDDLKLKYFLKKYYNHKYDYVKSMVRKIYKNYDKITNKKAELKEIKTRFKNLQCYFWTPEFRQFYYN